MLTDDRLGRIREELRWLHLDALLVSRPENRFYLSKFNTHDSGSNSAGMLVIAADAQVLITDGRFTEQAPKEAPHFELIIRKPNFPETFAETVLARGWKQIGFEAEHLTVATHLDFAAAAYPESSTHETGNGGQPEMGGEPAFHLIVTRGLVESMRMIKDLDELDLIGRAVAITDQTFTHLVEYLRPGLTEREVAQEIERYMAALGADGQAFDPIVASGPNAALPHAISSERRLQPGEPVIIDMGARLGGYCSDMTRTLCLGEPADARLPAIYDVVLAAQQAAEKGIEAGMSGQEADALARTSIEAAGYAKEFLHGTGHALGLEIHESPRLGKGATNAILRAGMVVTVEPGIYIPDWGGVRIEDTVLVTAHGLKILTQSPKEMVIPTRS